jgi:hypothetical protein
MGILPKITFKFVILLPIGELLCPSAHADELSENRPVKTSVPALYRSALDDYQNKRWVGAREKFQKIAQAVPDSLLAYEATFFAIMTKMQKESGFETSNLEKLPDGEIADGEITDGRIADRRIADGDWPSELQVWECQVALKLKDLDVRPKDVQPADQPADQAAVQPAVQAAVARLRSRVEQSRVEQARCFLREKQWVWASHSLRALRKESEVASDTDGASEANSAREEISSANESFRSWLDRSELECCVQLQRWGRAEELLQQMQPSLLTYLAQREPPAWVSQVLLWKSEIAILRGEWDLAELTVCDIRAHFPECNERGYVDYLFARCLVFNARFDATKVHRSDSGV